MKVMVFVKATKSSEAGLMPSVELLEAMTTYNEELVKHGIMLAGEGLKPSSQAARVRFSGAKRTVLDGPFAETKELVAGYWIWNVKSLEEAIEWVKKCPNPMPEDSDIEIRPIYELADFGDIVTPELKERFDNMQRAADAAAVAPARFEQGRPLVLAGLNAHYTLETRAGIPAQWMKFVPYMGQVPGQVGKTTYGVSWNCQANCDFDYLCAVEVDGTAPRPAELTRLELMPQRYAVFVHEEHYSALPQLLEAIFGTWLPKSGFQPAEAPCFERYTEEFNPETGKGGTEVWIPVKS